MQNTSKKYTYPLFETVSFMNGKFRLQEFHLQRMERSAKQLFGTFFHKNIFNQIIFPKYKDHIQYKCRIAYNKSEFIAEFSEYKRKFIERIKIVEAPKIDYSLKFSDRSAIENLKAEYPEFDEILITQNGFLCDTSMANIVLAKNDKFFTPETCLLEGVQRAYIVNKKLIQKRPVHILNLKDYDYIVPVNAMNGLEEAQKIYIENIEG